MLPARVILGDCLQELPALAENSIDSMVTDPPCALNFMGKKWDTGAIAFHPDTWRKCLRVLKPGGHLLAFGGARTYHRLAVAIEDGGFEIRDCINWVYGSGMPKGNNIAKVYAPASDFAKQWAGWNTGLKPAHELVCLARKPIEEKTIAANVAKWGTGAINIDSNRIQMSPDDKRGDFSAFGELGEETCPNGIYSTGRKRSLQNPAQGRWPANVIRDGSPEVLDEFAKASRFFQECSLEDGEREDQYSNVFYCGKASPAERNAGLDDFPEKFATQVKNFHPTVKPLKLIRYLCRLITPPGGVVLDPFAGSGTTALAALLEGFGFIAIEREKEYYEIACGRVAACQINRGGV